ncbi:VP2 minor capsid protein [Calicivirus isolate TCG]|uniref:VP2 minor capsid protein n=1 Tax=Calicivirus isolate TCG TaxID=243550 RepID=UPI00004E1969|nr:VP2 minor capsid protein [Calicivirus isolate TCG]BAD90665.1 VP2 minor capsid protein [Calicivirus isolate TCG]
MASAATAGLTLLSGGASIAADIAAIVTEQQRLALQKEQIRNNYELGKQSLSLQQQSIENSRDRIRLSAAQIKELGLDPKSELSMLMGLTAGAQPSISSPISNDQLFLNSSNLARSVRWDARNFGEAINTFASLRAKHQANPNRPDIMLGSDNPNWGARATGDALSVSGLSVRSNHFGSGPSSLGSLSSARSNPFSSASSGSVGGISLRTVGSRPSIRSVFSTTSV